MIIEIDEIDLRRYGPAALRAARPDLVRLADVVRHNLREVEVALGIEQEITGPSAVVDGICADLCAAEARIESLEHDLSTARARIEYLDSKLTAFEDDEEDKVYRKVGLVPSADPVVIEAARRALLARLHPDRAHPADKPRTTARFAVASAAFDRIAELRGRG